MNDNVHFNKYTPAERKEMDGILLKIHHYVKFIEHKPAYIVAALMVLVADYAATSVNSTDDIVEQFKLCVQQSRGEGQFAKEKA